VDPRFLVRSSRRHGTDTIEVDVDAPRVARYAQPGQFVIVRASSDGERIPLTICHADPPGGTIGLVVQAAGRTTSEMQALEVGDRLADVLGPLGRPTEIEAFGTCVVVAGGVGVAIGLPVARALANAGNEVIGIYGARSEQQLILEDRLVDACDVTHVCTEDGSRGSRGLVTDVLADVLDRQPIDRVFVVGPIAMMAAVADLTRPLAITTIASLNPIMVDGTGMCGGCRVTVDGETRFACIEGPEFDAHEVDFVSLALRNRSYRDFEVCEMDLSGAHHG
jgi:ferredoxin--NADP+ reductase